MNPVGRSLHMAPPAARNAPHAAKSAAPEFVPLAQRDEAAFFDNCDDGSCVDILQEGDLQAYMYEKLHQEELDQVEVQKLQRELKECQRQQKKAGLAACPHPEHNQKAESAKEGEKTDKPKGVKAKVKSLIDTYRMAEYSPITFFKDHAKGIAGTAAAAGMGALAFVLAPGTEDSVSEALDIADNLTSGVGVGNQTELCENIGNLLGVSHKLTSAVGGAAVAGDGVGYIIRGVSRTAKGIKKKDELRAARGMRTTTTGVRRIAVGAAVAGLKMGGAISKAAKFIQKKVVPQFRKISAPLNLFIGGKALVKGIKNKNKTEIINGALDLAYGSAVVGVIAVGGPVAAAVSGGLLGIREAWNWGKKISRYVRRDQFIQEQRRRAEELQDPNSAQRPGETQADPKPSKVKQVAKAIKDKAVNFLVSLTESEKLKKPPKGVD